MSVDIELAGVSDILQYLDDMGVNVDATADDALKAGAKIVQDDAKATSAFADHSGKLRKSIKMSGVKRGAYGGKYIRVYSNDPVAHLVEFGHSGDVAPAHPFLQPALEKNESQVNEIIKSKLVEALQK